MQVITPTDSISSPSNNAANSSDSGFLFSTSDPKTTPSVPVVSSSFDRRSSGSSGAPRQTSPNRRNSLIATVLVILALVGLVAGISWFKARRDASTAQAPNLPTRSSVLSDLFQRPQEAFTIQGSDASKLAIFGTGGSTTLAFAAPQGTNTITMPAFSGTICLDSNNCQFVRQVDLAQNIAMQGGPGVTLTDRTISNSGVLAVNGLAGRLSIQGTIS